MKEYFGIRYEFDRAEVVRSIDKHLDAKNKGFICIADGVVLSYAGSDPGYCSEIRSSILSVCDSNWVPVYLNLIYGENYNSFSGSELFEEILTRQKYKMMFLGATSEQLHNLKKGLMARNVLPEEHSFVALPFCSHESFDYEVIADRINAETPDIIWVGLGAPKQERFMYRLLPLLDRGIMIGVGAVFKFYAANTQIRRAPIWMINHRLEWVYRLLVEPEKQIKRIMRILQTTPFILFREYQKKKLC